MVQMELLDQLAARVGLHPAILLMKVRAWTRTNERKGQQQKDGRYWMYNSIAAWHAELPYLSEKQIRTALTSLRNNGYLLAEKAKKHQWNQTLHYALSDAALAVFQGIEDQNESNPMDTTHSSDESDAQVKPLCPDNDIDLPTQANDTNGLPKSLPCNEMIPVPPLPKSPDCSQDVSHEAFMERLDTWKITELEMHDFLQRTGRPAIWAYQWLGIMLEDIRSGHVSEYRSPLGALMKRHKKNWSFPRPIMRADLPERKTLQKRIEATRLKMEAEYNSARPDCNSLFNKLHKNSIASAPVLS